MCIYEMGVQPRHQLNGRGHFSHQLPAFFQSSKSSPKHRAQITAINYQPRADPPQSPPTFHYSIKGPRGVTNKSSERPSYGHFPPQTYPTYSPEWSKHRVGHATHHPLPQHGRKIVYHDLMDFPIPVPRSGHQKRMGKYG